MWYDHQSIHLIIVPLPRWHLFIFLRLRSLCALLQKQNQIFHCFFSYLACASLRREKNWNSSRREGKRGWQARDKEVHMWYLIAVEAYGTVTGEDRSKNIKAPVIFSLSCSHTAEKKTARWIIKAMMIFPQHLWMFFLLRNLISSRARAATVVVCASENINTQDAFTHSVIYLLRYLAS